MRRNQGENGELQDLGKLQETSNFHETSKDLRGNNYDFGCEVLRSPEVFKSAVSLLKRLQ
jgi:hypothetical protein